MCFPTLLNERVLTFIKAAPLFLPLRDELAYIYIYIYVPNSRQTGPPFVLLSLPRENEIPFPSFRPFARVTSALRLAHGAPRSFINERVYLERKTGEGGRRTRASGLRVVKCTVSTWCDARFTRLECKVALDTRARALINN